MNTRDVQMLPCAQRWIPRICLACCSHHEPASKHFVVSHSFVSSHLCCDSEFFPHVKRQEHKPAMLNECKYDAVRAVLQVGIHAEEISKNKLKFELYTGVSGTNR